MGALRIVGTWIFNGKRMWSKIAECALMCGRLWCFTNNVQIVLFFPPFSTGSRRTRWLPRTSWTKGSLGNSQWRGSYTKILLWYFFYLTFHCNLTRMSFCLQLFVWECCKCFPAGKNRICWPTRPVGSGQRILHWKSCAEGNLLRKVFPSVEWTYLYLMSYDARLFPTLRVWKEVTEK